MAEGRREIQFDVKVETTQATQGVRSLNEAFDETASASGTVANSVRLTSEQVEQGGRKWGELAGAVGNVGSVIAVTNPQMAQASSIIGGVGTAASALTGALGPLGVAIAAVTTAYGVFQIASTRAQEAHDAAREAAERHRQTMEGLAGSYRTTANAIRETRRALAEQVAGTQEAVDQQEALVAGIEEQLERTRRARGRHGGIANAALDEQIQRMEMDLQIARFRLEQIRGAREFNEAGADLASSPANNIAEAARTAAKTRADAEREATEAILETIRHEYEERERMAEAHTRMLLAERAERQRDLDERMAAVDRDIQAEGQRYDREQSEREAEWLADVRRARDQAAEARREWVDLLEHSKESMQSFSAGVIGPMVGKLTDALSNVVAGAESAEDAFEGMLSSFLEAIATQAALEAAKEFAAAIGSFASQDYASGALHLAAGAAWTGVAVAAGAGAVATAPAEAAPAAPQAGAANDNGGGSSYTFNINGPVVSAGTRANLGRELSSIIGEGERRFARA